MNRRYLFFLNGSYCSQRKNVNILVGLVLKYVVENKPLLKLYLCCNV